MPGFSLSRTHLLAVIAVVFLLSIGLTVAVAMPVGPQTVVVNHWANIYMMDDDLLPAFAKRFNATGARTSTGQRIEVRPVLVNSGVINDELSSRVRTGHSSGACNQSLGGCPSDLADPALVTPAAEQWFRQLDLATGQMVIDPAEAAPLVTTYIGIVMQRDMARCLGWPNQEIGIADIIALRQDPRGWASCPTSRTEWGQQPLLSFTDPQSSSTGRSMLFALYGIAAGKAPADLTLDDVANPAVVNYVREFQRGVDHYVPDSVILASKIYAGPRYGHFFFVPEVDLVKLYQGKLAVTTGIETKPKPLEQDMVVVYPREGSAAHRDSAAPIHASWVTPQQQEAARIWVEYLRAPEQQAEFARGGFRPAVDIPYVRPPASRFIPEPGDPKKIVDPDRIDPAVAEAIVNGWGEVKKPGVVTFVVDTSGSMSGGKLEQAKQGMSRVLDSIARRNLVGFLTFASQVNDHVPVGPITNNRYRIQESVDRMHAGGETALYDAIRAAIEMTDQAEADPDTIRGVVVLTDGRSNKGGSLDSIVRLTSSGEQQVPKCTGFEGNDGCRDIEGALVLKRDLIGSELAIETRHPIHVFFVGIGDADLDVGRVLAEATHSAYKPATEKNLASVLETFGQYF